MVTPRGEYFHDRSDDPHWNESGWFSFMVPERRLSAMVYCYHRPNMGYSTGGFAAWDPSGDRFDANMITWPCYPTIHAWFTHYEWELDGGLRAPGEEQE
jgi:hypothetical protein